MRFVGANNFSLVKNKIGKTLGKIRKTSLVTQPTVECQTGRSSIHPFIHAIDIAYEGFLGKLTVWRRCA